MKKDTADIPPETYPQLFICTPTCCKHAEYGPKDMDHATIEEIPLDQPYTDESKLISHIPDFPQGTMYAFYETTRQDPVPSEHRKLRRGSNNVNKHPQ